MNWLKHTYASRLPKSLYAVQAPIPVNDPKIGVYNDALAASLGIQEYLPNQEQALAVLSGNELIPDSQPIAQAYAGHQFGYFNKLGDGRAVLIGEIETTQGLLDVQLKGSGPTPFSRRGDGRATYYSMLREYLISEAMHALGIPTTRSLAVVKTGEKVYRELVQDGAILTRIAASHIRVGTFEYARFLGEKGDVTSLLHYTIQRHYPELLDNQNYALALLEQVMKKQIALIIHWLRVGFIHGVMNTDNMAISGETIDYGPCAFMNDYDPKTVFSSIDTNGRYAFANQPGIAHWNLSVFANALLSLIDKEEEKAKSMANEVLNRFPRQFSKAYHQMMSQKLGFRDIDEQTSDLAQECLELLAEHRVDYTNFFTSLRREQGLVQELRRHEKFEAWYLRWKEARNAKIRVAESKKLMLATNPVVIPRNHIVEEVLYAAVDGNMDPFNRLLSLLANPYNEDAAVQEVPVGYDAEYQTFCGT